MWWKFNNKKKVAKQTIEQRLDQLEHLLTAEREDRQLIEVQLDESNKELSLLRDKQKKYDDKRNSPEPWVEVIGESIDEIKGIIINLDWNDAFIQYLKENGISAQDEDAAVQKWLALMYQDLVEKFDSRVIENNSKKTVSDYL